MKLQKFNLIEIALAIGILAVGMTSIVTLFPLGLNEVNNAIRENYSSEASVSMMALIQTQAYSDWNGTISLIPTEKPVIDSAGNLNPGDWITPAEENGNIYEITDLNATPSTTDGIFGIRVTTGSGTNTNEFAGEALMWKSLVEDIMVNGSFMDPSPGFDEAAALHLEISWPVEKPYGQREKKTYYLELFNFN